MDGGSANVCDRGFGPAVVVLVRFGRGCEECKVPVTCRRSCFGSGELVAFAGRRNVKDVFVNLHKPGEDDCSSGSTLSGFGSVKVC